MNQQTRDEILQAFADVRVADVRDGMDTLGLHHTGSMDLGIRPLWRTRAVGLARTACYRKWEGEVPADLTPETYWEWSSWYYNNVCTYPWVDEIEPGDFAVIDQNNVNAGLMGSENTLKGLINGVRGFVIQGGPRDTDEIIMQKVPVWSQFICQSMVQGRLEYVSHNEPVTVGGIEVCPGDVVVADGDGVIVVPQDKALDVAYEANAEHRRDMANRRSHYLELGRTPDNTVADG